MTKTLNIKKEKNKLVDMTTGSPYKLILLFSLPLLLGNIFQQLYNMVDSIVVGQFVGSEALAAVGTGFPVIFLMNSLFFGIGIGASIMISQFFGAKDFNKVNKTIGTIYTAMLIGAIPLTIIGLLIISPTLSLLNVPQGPTFDMASSYMFVIFLGSISALGYNINAGILQGLGNSKTTLLFLSVACFINIVLDIVFTVFMGMGVIGVAIATVIAQSVSWLYGLFYINKHYKQIEIKPFKFIFDKKLFKKSIALGIPTGIQNALFAVGTMVIQALVNAQGPDFMAGFNGANKIDTLGFLPIQSFATAVTTYAGQNIGAMKYDRVKKGAISGVIMSVIVSLVLAIIMVPTAPYLMQLFNNNPAVIDAGVQYLIRIMPFYSLLSVLFILNGVMRGAGDMIIPMI
ncbi:MAG: MATE family efflux transporter, partial [Clostridia bacterium]